MSKSYCVYCGSSPGARPEYLEAARTLGQEFAARDIRLVYGGGNVGLMGCVADAVLEAGGNVIGVIPKALAEKEVAHLGLSDLRIVSSMHERKFLMADLSDGFIALPGGLGTFEEVFEALTWCQLGVHRKPCGALNVCGYFAPLTSMLDHAVTERFLHPMHRDLLLVASEAPALLDQLASFSPPETPKWLDRNQF